jgi:hypothetical protein
VEVAAVLYYSDIKSGNQVFITGTFGDRYLHPNPEVEEYRRPGKNYLVIIAEFLWYGSGMGDL